MTQILLGDCAATGEDILLPAITGINDLTEDDRRDPKKFEKQIILWYLKNSKNKTDIESISHQAYLYKIKKEKELAWPMLLGIDQNLAVVGETWQGMHNKLKKYLANNPAPEVVMATDFASGHRCVVINRDGRQYVVRRELAFIEMPQRVYPLDIYDVFVDKYKQQEVHGPEYQNRKNRKSLALFAKLCEKHKITLKVLIFRKETLNMEHMTQYQLTDCTHLEKCLNTLEGQKTIAEYIKKHQ
tara:strand:+ start:493 stop:1221 length:729 start_codon:yes stop_codon:yes gene_type:complete